MGGRNKKNVRAVNRVAVWGVSGAAVLSVLAVLYLSLLNHCEQLGRQLKKLEAERAELQKRVVNEEHNWETARGIANMERLMAQHHIEMSWPSEANIIRLCRTDGGESETGPAQYARRD